MPAAGLPALSGGFLPGVWRGDRAGGIAGYAFPAAPVLILLYALVGTPWPLVLAICATVVAEIVVFRRPIR